MFCCCHSGRPKEALTWLASREWVTISYLKVEGTGIWYSKIYSRKRFVTISIKKEKKKRQEIDIYLCPESKWSLRQKE